MKQRQKKFENLIKEWLDEQSAGDKKKLRKEEKRQRWDQANKPILS